MKTYNGHRSWNAWNVALTIKRHKNYLVNLPILIFREQVKNERAYKR